MTTHIRHYSLYVLTFLAAILLYMQYRKNKRVHWLFFACASLALMTLLDVQAILPVLVIGLLLVAAVVEPKKGAWSNPLLWLNSALLVAVPLYLVLQPFSNSHQGFIQFAAYHFSGWSWALVWLVALIGAIMLMRKERGLNIIFFAPWLILPLAGELVGRELLPRYTAMFFPLFILLLAVFFHDVIEWGASLFEKASDTKLLFATFISVVLVIALGANFVLPFQPYTKGDIWPQNYKDNQLLNHPLVTLKEAHSRFMIEELDGGSAAVLADEAWTIHWYTNVNPDTQASFEGYWLADHSGLKKWSFTRDEAGYTPFESDALASMSLFETHTGLPIVSTPAEFNEVFMKHPRGYVVLSGYKDRVSDELLEHVQTKTDLVFDDGYTYVYAWES